MNFDKPQEEKGNISVSELSPEEKNENIKSNMETWKKYTDGMAENIGTISTLTKEMTENCLKMNGHEMISWIEKMENELKSFKEGIKNNFS